MKILIANTNVRGLQNNSDDSDFSTSSLEHGAVLVETLRINDICRNAR